MTAIPPSSAAGITGHILVVDDREENRLLLSDLLEAQGHRVREAGDGREALQLVGEETPDLILLDVEMPGMDGFEVCRRLKADPLLATIPVLMVTALSQRDQRLQGMAAGANDYITKPIDRAELGLRVVNALRLRRLHRELEAQYRKLEEMERLRDNLVHMIVHDLRSPLAAIHTYMDLLRLEAGELMAPAFQEIIAEAGHVVSAMTDMVTDLIDVSRLESGQMPLTLQDADLGVLAEEALSQAGAKTQRLEVRLVRPPAPARASCDAGVIRRVITNLVANAIKFTPPGGQVVITVSSEPHHARVRVQDTGSGIAPHLQERIFDKFGQGDPATRTRHSSGLGLTFCKLAVESHGGQIGVESEPEKGSTFWFILPSQPTASAEVA